MLHVEQNYEDQLGVSRGTLDRLKIYKNLLEKWQKSINIVSRGTIDDFWNRHILDSLQISDYIIGEKVLDIGSGGGFPGMVIAICTDFKITCIDSDTRKIVFLEEVARVTETSVEIIADRIENLKNTNFDTVCARGFAKLSALIPLVHKYSRKSYGVFLKGKTVNEEIEEAQKKFKFKYELFPSKTNKSGNIIVVSEIEKIESKSASHGKDL